MTRKWISRVHGTNESAIMRTKTCHSSHFIPNLEERLRILDIIYLLNVEERVVTKASMTCSASFLSSFIVTHSSSDCSFSIPI